MNKPNSLQWYLYKKYSITLFFCLVKHHDKAHIKQSRSVSHINNYIPYKHKSNNKYLYYLLYNIDYINIIYTRIIISNKYSLLGFLLILNFKY